MGWASGSGVAESLWELLRPYVAEVNRKKVANKVIAVFEGNDCDTIDECQLLCRDAGRKPNYD